MNAINRSTERNTTKKITNTYSYSLTVPFTIELMKKSIKKKQKLKTIRIITISEGKSNSHSDCSTLSILARDY